MMTAHCLRRLGWLVIAMLTISPSMAQVRSFRDRSNRGEGNRSGSGSSFHRRSNGHTNFQRGYRGGVYRFGGNYFFAPNYFFGGSPDPVLQSSSYFPLGYPALATVPLVNPPAFIDPFGQPNFGFGLGPIQHPVAPMLPPVAGENFARRSEGVRAFDPVPAAANAELAVEPGFDGLNEIRRRVSVLKSSTPQSRQRADRLISSGDAAFAAQKLARANALYRDAIAKAPDYAAGHFRLAHSYLASRQYTLAQKSLMVALELSGSIKRGGFSLEDIYQGDQFVRDKHFETLLDASLREPNDGGLMLLLGFFLHYDNKPLQAREYFNAANKIAGLHQNYTRYFLPAKPIKEL